MPAVFLTHIFIYRHLHATPSLNQTSKQNQKNDQQATLHF